MKYALLVLVNNKNPFGAVDFLPVTDAFTAGGVFLDETALLPYDAPLAVSEYLARVSSECDGVFLVCDRALLPSAKGAVSSEARAEFSGEVVLETEKCLFAVLPTGKEGAELVSSEVMPFVDRRRGNMYCREVVCFAGAPSEIVRSALQDARDAAGDKLLLHLFERDGQGKIQIVYDKNTPKMTADEVVRILATELSDYVYSLRDESIAERLLEALKLHRLKISTAESFTGGGVGREIVRVAGASEVFFEGLNTYNSASKISRLGVSEETLRTEGAVSDETAYEMAAGLLASGNCDVAIATTGYAGPAAEGSNEPVGLCFLAVGTKERVRVYRHRFSGDRESITARAITYALHYAYREIK